MFVRCIFLKGKWHRITVNKLERLLTLIHKIHQTIANNIIVTHKIIAISKTIDSQVYKMVILLVKEIIMVIEIMIEEMVKRHIIKKVINLKDPMVKKIKLLKLLLTLVRLLQTIIQQTKTQTKNLIIKRKITRLIKNLIQKYMNIF